MAKVETNLNLEYIQSKFEMSLLPDGDVDLLQYTLAYKELFKFCELMGKLWGFVGSEISRHVKTLTELRKTNEDSYSTLRRMVKYELSNKSTRGCKSLLLLHRGLDFIRNFLKRTCELGPEEKMSTMGQDVYAETLGKFHNAVIRKAASIAMYILPTRDQLVQRISGGDNEILDFLPKMLEAANQVYKRTHVCLQNNSLLDLC